MRQRATATRQPNPTSAPGSIPHDLQSQASLSSRYSSRSVLASAILISLALALGLRLDVIGTVTNDTRVNR
ncbi:hypothetical protein H4R35_001921 [Dimargaris xerosporica]|nr:hypothetical protein H4R35_001921 [Dimargaris xerosporica]